MSQSLSYDNSNQKVPAGVTVYKTGDHEYAFIFFCELRRLIGVAAQ